MKKNLNGFLIIVSACLCLYLTSAISAMQMGGFDIDVGSGENSNWQWQEEQQWNQNSWESNWQTGDNISKTPAQSDEMYDNGYQYDSDTGNVQQDYTQQWSGVQQNDTGWDNNFQLHNNLQGSNGTQSNNNIQSNNSVWNNQSQMDNSTHATFRTDNETTITTEEISPMSTPAPTPGSTKNPKPTQTPQATQTPTPKPSKKKKKNKKKQNKAKKESKSADNSKEIQNINAQMDTAKYKHIKDEIVKFHCVQNPDNPHTPQIQIISRGSVQILSVRLNGIECSWHWEEDWIIPESDDLIKGNINKIEMMVISQGGKLIKMDPWNFSS